MNHRKSAPYQPFSPPICSIDSHTFSIGASVITSRRSLKIISPAHAGSLCAFCHGAVGIAASDQRVSTALAEMRLSANSIALVTSVSPSGGSGIIPFKLFFGSATTSFINEPTNGRARAVGTGVTNPIHKLDSLGVSTGTLIINRFRSPEILANFCIISA